MKLTYSSFIDKARRELSAVYEAEEAKSLAFRLFESVEQVPVYRVISAPDTEIPEDRAMRLSGMLEELKNCRPLQYVIGEAEFGRLTFKVKEGVLIPRSETEELLMRAVEESSGTPAVIMDLCTGSGCLAWSLADFYPSARVYAFDLSDAALEIAASQQVGKGHPEIVKADVLQMPPLSGIPDMKGQVDLLVSNPPYVRVCEKALMHRNVLDYEPDMALFVEDDDPLVFYRALARHAAYYLSGNGRGYFEINEAFGPETAECFRAEGFRSVEVIRDLNGRDRMVRILR